MSSRSSAPSRRALPRPKVAFWPLHFTGKERDSESGNDYFGDISSDGFTAETDYVLDQAGHQVTELQEDANGRMVWKHTNVWAGGDLLGTYAAVTDSNQQPDGELHFYMNDWLGTRRVQVNYAGTWEDDCVSLPFGDQESCTPTPTEHLFTGKERDSESGNDYFGARYYASSMGRFLSPDWSATVMPVPYAKLGDPQTLNLYAYVGNNPLSRTDPTGHYLDKCGAGDKNCEKGVDNFEKQRQKDLKSKHEDVRNAAAAWGKRGEDNHINVIFKTQQQVDADAGTAPGYRTDAMVTPGTTGGHTPEVNAEFSESLKGSDLGQTLAHEGSHIEDDMFFLNSYSPATGKYNWESNITHGDTEFKAFGTGSEVKPYSMFPSGPRGYQQMENYINQAYPNANDLVFPPAEFPQ